MKFTILGASGFIGVHLYARLHADGHDVFAPRRNDATIFSQNLGHVFYCVGLTADFRSRPFDTMRAHVCLLADILEKARFDSLLYLSSTRIYGKCATANESTRLSVDVGDPSDLYNLSKLAGESLCLNSTRSTIRIARLSNVYGGDFASNNFLATLIRDAVNESKVVLKTAARSEKDYISINDVITLLPRIALEGQHRLYNVASGVNVTHGAILERLAEIVDCRASFTPGAPSISFPTIDISRLWGEFAFQAASVLEDMPLLVQQYRECKT